MNLFQESYENCYIDRRGAILIVTINRPAAMNAVTPAANHELAQVFRAYEADPELRVAIITGAGEKAFCAGNDLKFMLTASREQMTQPLEGFGGLTEFFDRKKPVIAAVNGIAYGGGFEIALAADVIVACRAAKFALPEPKVGLAALAGGMHRLSRQIPLKKAVAMMITAESVGADEGYELGFVNQVVDGDQLLDACLRYAEKILACSPISVSVTLEAVREGAKFNDIRDAMKMDQALAVRIGKSRDFREGVKAFAEKRPPQWKGC